ncbi:MULTISPECIES: MFS transporter [unclassified Bradyrhizobium]|uniref:MFS transporter n=1 Tax=unclassified Bradyrhizobium TaxID=2631580 RepID=UPI00247AABAB|nr:MULTISPECIES: MFS transporter [unclassified Bradyrhizobium]WGR73188.1 MFS transporter [Bradyrhizobium sp. ISRA426]WGR78027.1 MFS transporter [Bradyrhizobium sp. ISRA430]WGR88428.1 MFS transporter [Bradyrhizobium sp. ISRA432]
MLVGAIISTLAGRLTSFGLADIRGAIHAGFDEGAWISTAFTVGQMLIGPPTIWLGATFGPRRVLLVSAGLYTLASILLPLSPDLPTFIGLYAVGGLTSGTFIPLTVSFVLRNLPAQFAVYGISAYAMNSELSQNIAASLEGWFTEHWSWQWIFWQNAFLAPLMMLCVWYGIPREPINREHLRSADWFGMLLSSVGLSMLYAALDQGNRLDWLNSGLICGLLLGGVVLVAAFVIHEIFSERPSVNLRWMIAGNMPLIGLLIISFRFVVLSTSLIIPQYLTTVQGFRALQTGDVLLWIALPQFIMAPLVAKMLQHIDARIPLALGFTLIGVACFMATALTRHWATDDFLASQIVQAIGQSLGFTALIWFSTRHLYVGDAFTFGVFLQTLRLFGGELGIALMTTYLRVREQIHSNFLGLHVTGGTYLTDERLDEYARAVLSRSVGAAEAHARATELLARAVQIQANVLSYIDAFTFIGLATIGSLVVIVLLRSPSPPAVNPVKG